MNLKSGEGRMKVYTGSYNLVVHDCIIFQNTSCLQQTLEDLSCKGLHCNTSTLDSLFYVNTLKFIRFVLDCENIKS